MKQAILIIMLIFWATGSIIAQGLVNKGVGIWIGDGTSLKIDGGYINQETEGVVGIISNNGTLSVRDHWTNNTPSGVVFTEDSQGAVELTGGNQTITGNTHFYDFTKRVTSSSTLTFQSGSTTTVKNSLTLEGASGQTLLLRSSIEDNQWHIVPPSSHVLRYLDIKDSNNTSSTITLEASCVSSFNNTNWLFTPTIAAWPSSADDIIHGQQLSDSTLNGGTVINGPYAVRGDFVFETPDFRPPIGTANHPIKFVPASPIYVEVVDGNIDVTVKEQPSPPALGAYPISTTEFTANWEVTIVSVKYNLDVSERPDFSSFLEGYNNKTVNSTSQLVVGLNPSSTYYYRVRAINILGALSKYSSTITVNTLPTKTLDVPSDSFPTIASALREANNLDTIQLASGPYGENDLNIERDIFIIGDSAKTTTLDAGYKGRMFNIFNGKTVTIKDLAIRHGKAADGGALLNYGTLTLENCEIRTCSASQTGGAINNHGKLNLSGTTFSDCTASTDGGGIYNSGTGSVMMENCTFASLENDELAPTCVQNKGVLSINSSLITNYVTGVTTTTGTTSITNSIIAGNNTNIEGDWTNNGHNITSGDPGLMPLDYYGGTTRTCALESASPALNNGQTDLASDQRGILRPQGTAADIGPFESRLYSTKFISGSNGTISGQLIQSIPEYNPTTEVTAVPAEKYHFLDWTKDGESYSSANPLTLEEVTTNLNLTANFSRNQFKVLFTTAGYGSLEGETDQTVSFQDTCTPVKAIAPSGWGFAKWIDQHGKIYTDNPIVFGPVYSSSELTAVFTQSIYTIKTSSNNGGNCQPSGNISVNMGDSLTIQVVPDGGYYTKEVFVDDNFIGSISSYTFNNVSDNHTLDATFAKTSATTWTITASNSNGGTISPVGNVAVETGNSATFTILPDDDWQISDIKVDNVSQGTIDTYTFSDVKSNHSIRAEFSEKPTEFFTITSSSGTGGTISPDGTSTVQKGGSKTFTIEANSNFYINQVFIDDVPIGAVSSYTFYNLSSNHSIHAEFGTTEAQNAIIATADNGGRIAPSGIVPVMAGNDITFTLTPQKGWEITEILIDQKNVAPTATYTFSTIDGDHSIHGKFAPITYTITCALTGGGEISPSGITTVTSGESQTFTFIPDGGFYLKNVIVDGNSVGAVSSYTFPNITSNHSLNAIFAKTEKQYISIISEAAAGGTISPAGIIGVPTGTSPVFTIKANSDFMIDDVKVDGNSVGGLESYCFENISTNHVISAEFKQIPPNSHVISSLAAKGGTITPNGQILVNTGDSLTFSITPEEGYSISDVKVDDSSVGAVTSYTMENITSNHKIKAEFEAFTYRISTIAGENGTITPSDEVLVAAGASQLFVFTPDSGYHVEDVIIDGTSHGKMVEYEFLEVYSDHLLEVRFATGEETYHVIHSSASRGGTISPLGRISVEAGEDANFAILPKYGMKIKEVLVDGESVETDGNYTFTNVTEKHTISASFEKDESGGGDLVLGVSMNDPNGGWLTPKPGKYAVSANMQVTLKAIASEKYIFDGWSIIGNAIIDNPRSQIIKLTITEPTELTANFTPIISQAQLKMQQYPIASGSISPSGRVSIEVGYSQQILANPAPGYEFNSWLILKGVGEIDDPNSSQTTLTATTDVDVAAIFIQQETLENVIIGSNGPGAVSPQGTLKVPLGSIITATPIAATDHKFTHWDTTEGIYAISPYSPDSKFLILGPGQLNANFLASDQVSSLTLSENNTGILQTETITNGAKRSISAQVPIHKVFDYWNCKNRSLPTADSKVINPYAPNTEVEVDQDLNVDVRFAKNQLTDSSISKIKLDIQADTMKTASGKIMMARFPSSHDTFDPSKDQLKLCINGNSYIFPEASIKQVGKKAAWTARLKDNTGTLRLFLDMQKGLFNFSGKKLLLDNSAIDGEVNCFLQVGAQYNYYRLSPDEAICLKFVKKSDEILERLPVTGKEIDDFSVSCAMLRVDSQNTKKNYLKIRKMTFDFPSKNKFDPSTEMVSLLLGDQCINIPPGAFESLSQEDTYRYNDKENQILITLDTLEGVINLAICNLKALPAGCNDGKLDVYLHIGDYSGGVRLVFNSVKKHLYLKGKGKKK